MPEDLTIKSKPDISRHVTKRLYFADAPFKKWRKVRGKWKSGETKKFGSVKDAQEYLRRKGFKPSQIEYFPKGAAKNDEYLEKIGVRKGEDIYDYEERIKKKEKLRKVS